MKTDLRKILAVTGESGLFYYVSQVRLGAILESLSTKQRNKFGLNAKMTSLADISIYTDEGETKLQDVFEAMHSAILWQTEMTLIPQNLPLQWLRKY